MITGQWISGNQVESVWEKIDPFVVKALKKWIPAWRPIDIMNYVKEGTMQLWIAYSEEEKKVYGVCMTQVDSYPLMKMLRIFLVGGTDLKKWRDMWVMEAEKMARANDCKVMQASGRRGWLHIPGAFESAVVINKILD